MIGTIAIGWPPAPTIDSSGVAIGFSASAEIGQGLVADQSRQLPEQFAGRGQGPFRTARSKRQLDRDQRMVGNVQRGCRNASSRVG